LGLWAVIVFLLLLLKRTRTARAWLSLIAVVLAIILWQLEGFSPLFISLGVVWLIIWLWGGRRTRTEGWPSRPTTAGFDHSVG
jgi:hypothetical protein